VKRQWQGGTQSFNNSGTLTQWQWHSGTVAVAQWQWQWHSGSASAQTINNNKINQSILTFQKNHQKKHNLNIETPSKSTKNSTQKNILN
jgi:hypothetical protein